jgi:DNA-binding NtrC family response regulator
MTGPRRILIIDDDASLVSALSGLLDHQGYEAEGAPSPAKALDAVRRRSTDVVLLDVRLGKESGLELLPKLKELRPETSVIVFTAAGSIEMAVEAMRLGADNFLLKPVDPPRLLAIVAKGLEACRLRRRSSALERLSARSATLLLGDSAAMKRATALAGTVAGRDTTVLLLGETGTGKGLLARRIHELSPRAAAPLVELNCAGLNRELTESELFGHEKGAFTGAAEKKLGLFEVADGGTLVLDEIGEMEASIQAKLLQVLETKRFRRVGGTTENEVDVRVITSTHRDLESDARSGRFRQDLLFRLNVFAITLPPLRARRDDIIPLALYFLHQAGRSGTREGALSDSAASRLAAYYWPGNVRELRNVMERAAILCPDDEPIQPEHLPQFAGGGESPLPLAPARTDTAPLPTLREAERQLIVQTLAAHGGNIRAAAKALDISRGTLYRKAEKFGIPLTT